MLWELGLYFSAHCIHLNNVNHKQTMENYLWCIS